MSYYFMGDLNIMYDKRLTANDKVVYYCLVSFMKKEDGTAFPRYATISKRCGLSKSSIQKSVKHLAKLHLITTKRLQSTNKYLLSQQLALETMVKKKQRMLSGVSEKYNRRVLIKPYNYTNTRYNKNNVNNYNKNNSLPPTTEQTFLVYKGKKYIESGKEGFWNEYYCKETGDKLRKHSFKNTIEEVSTSKKKFDAAAEKAVACAS
ncbi:DnaD and phage-associated domain-containing protein [uncultured Mediterranean phage uvMED]|nr:DnaD and phage-associated domain-containing protein [uncultured Mediterranean phage uvMED]|tara:strand:+ start:325 stop:942 length:618 start_codon:yes stop_codon:yes gene_type:complete